MLSFPLSTIIEAGLAGYILLGASSLGYVMMRSGWPTVRTISMEYKSGLSILSGAAFSFGIVGIAFVPRFLKPIGLQFSVVDFLFTGAAVFSAAGIALFTARRLLAKGKKVRVVVPKRVVTANIVSRMAMEKVPEKLYTKTAEGEGVPVGEALGRRAVSAVWAGSVAAGEGMPSRGIDVHEEMGAGIVVVTSRPKKGGGDKVAEQYTIIPTSETAASEARVEELKSRLISKKYNEVAVAKAVPEPAGRTGLEGISGAGEAESWAKATHEAAARARAKTQEEGVEAGRREAEKAQGEMESRGAVFEPTKEIIEKIVEKQKSVSAKKAISEVERMAKVRRQWEASEKEKRAAPKATTQSIKKTPSSTTAPIAGKAEAGMKAATSTARDTETRLPSTGQKETQPSMAASEAITVKEERKGILSFMFGGRKAIAKAGAPQPPTATPLEKPTGPATATPQKTAPLIASIGPAGATLKKTFSQTAPRAKAEKTSWLPIGAAQAPQPTWVSGKKALPAPPVSKSGMVEAARGEGVGTGYISGKPLSAEKLAELRKKLEEFDSGMLQGGLLAQRPVATGELGMKALGKGIEVEAGKHAATGHEKSVEEIMEMLERQKAKRVSVIVTREEASEEMKDSTSFIRQELKERLGLRTAPLKSEVGSKETATVEALPKSARLLKELLREA